jgi:transposase
MSIMMETMGRKKARPRRSFTKEFKAEVVELVRQPGNSAASVARDLDLTQTAVRAWVKQADIDDGDREGLTSAQLAELAALRKENRVLREERDILKRATAFFAREIR